MAHKIGTHNRGANHTYPLYKVLFTNWVDGDKLHRMLDFAAKNITWNVNFTFYYFTHNIGEGGNS